MTEKDFPDYSQEQKEKDATDFKGFKTNPPKQKYPSNYTPPKKRKK